MAKVFRRLPVESVEYSANALKTRQLPLTVLKQLQLRLKVTHTNAGAETITPLSLCNLISKIQIVLNGQDNYASFPLYHLFYCNKKEFGIAPLYSIDAAAGAGKVSYVNLILPFYLPNAIAPEDTLLDARSLTSCNLEVQWGNSIGSVGAVVTAATLEIVTGEFVGVAGDAKFARHELGYAVQNLDKIDTIQHKLDVGSNNQYRRVWVYAFNNAGVLADALVTRLGVSSRSFYYVQTPVDHLQGAMNADYRVANDAGVYVIDFCPDGKMSQRVDARPLSELILELTSSVANGSFAVIKEKVIYS